MLEKVNIKIKYLKKVKKSLFYLHNHLDPPMNSIIFIHLSIAICNTSKKRNYKYET